MSLRNENRKDTVSFQLGKGEAMSKSDSKLYPEPMPDGWYEGSPEWEAAHEEAAKIAKGLMDAPPKTQTSIVAERKAARYKADVKEEK